MKMNKVFGVVALSSLMLVSCKKDDKNPDDHHHDHENELITTVQLNFSSKGISGNDTTFTVSFDDPDGTGGNKPTSFDTIRFAANKTYTCDLILLDKSKNPVDTISNEVEEEGADHMFFFNSIAPTGTPYNTYLSGSMTNIKYLDLDANQVKSYQIMFYDVPKNIQKIEARISQYSKNENYR